MSAPLPLRLPPPLDAEPGGEARAARPKAPPAAYPRAVLRRDDVRPDVTPPDAAASAERQAEEAASDSPHLGGKLLSGLLPAPPFLPPGDVVVVDVETTGWLADAASITEIGAVRLSPGRPMAEFSALVNPGAPIPPDITSLTGITDAMVSGAPRVGAVLPGFLRFASGAVMVAHNAPFDVGFLAAACRASGLDLPTRAVIDTAVLSRMMLSTAVVPDHRLATLAGHFGARTGPCHRALADAKATAVVLAGLLAVLSRGPVPAPGPPAYQRPERRRGTIGCRQRLGDGEP